jgi:hypothetical protein
MSKKKVLKKKVSKKRIARIHAVSAELENFKLAKTKSALTIRLLVKGKRAGEVQMGSGGLFWRGRRKQSGMRMSWTQFAEMMNDRAYGK